MGKLYKNTAVGYIVTLSQLTGQLYSRWDNITQHSRQDVTLGQSKWDSPIRTRYTGHSTWHSYSTTQ